MYRTKGTLSAQCFAEHCTNADSVLFLPLSILYHDIFLIIFAFLLIFIPKSGIMFLELFHSFPFAPSGLRSIPRRHICGGLVATRDSKFDSWPPHQLQVGISLTKYLLHKSRPIYPGRFLCIGKECDVMTVCPLNGNCVYSHKADTGSDFCGRPECAYPRLQREELVRAISELENLQNLTEVHMRKLRRYRAYLRKLV